MGRIASALLLSGGLWLLGATTLQAEPYSHSPRVYERHAPVLKKHPTGEVSFETLRMLSTGMTKAEVLSRAGPPRYGFKNRGTQQWVYAASDNWIVEITFGGNRVAEINWSRSRP